MCSEKEIEAARLAAEQRNSGATMTMGSGKPASGLQGEVRRS